MNNIIGIRYHKFRIVLFCFLAIFAFAAFTPGANASSGFFADPTKGDCSSCHTGQTGSSFCGMCHAHGAHPNNQKSSVNVTAATNKSDYAPGETVSVTISGGYRPSQARAILYNQSMTQVAISTGTPSSGGGPVNAPAWTGMTVNGIATYGRTLSAPAPTAPGTYTWKAAWYGNLYDKSGAAFGGANWVPDPSNADHGEERASVTFTVTAPAPILTSISVSPSSASVAANGTQQFTATAKDQFGNALVTQPVFTWTVSGGGTINGSGLFTAGSTAGGPYTVRAASGVVSGTASVTVTAPAPILTSISVSPSSASVAANGTQQFTATAKDQFGNALVTQPVFTWTVSGGGTINGSGLFTAGSTAGGPYTVRAASGVVSGTASVTVTDVPGDTTDTVPPTVISTNPPDLAVDVYVNTAIEATFSEQIDPSSLESGNIRVRDPANIEVPGAVSYSETSKTATFSPSTPLAYGTVYTAEVKLGVTDLAGNRMASLYKWTFTTQQASPDSDGDGVGDDDDESPHDCRNATPRTPRGNGKIQVELVGSAPGCLKNVKTSTETSSSITMAVKPAGYEFPDGLVYYEVEGIPPGSTETVLLTYPQPHSAGSKVFKVDASGFQEFSGGSISGKTVTLIVTDGGAGDLDGLRDGVITDPVGVGSPVDPGGSIDLGTSASGGGCSVVGAGGGWKEAAGFYGLIALAWLGLALRRRRPKTGK
ncbi:MAG: fibronectin type III domain-containing protein [Deltaproteobacteria bacterium CSP1-8]|nr:MAG: fibronectin type III domain-containing protein [Deltaproteobacteria bacterium CSP1-8]